MSTPLTFVSFAFLSLLFLATPPVAGQPTKSVPPAKPYVEPADRPFQLCVETKVHIVSEALKKAVTNLDDLIITETFRILTQINSSTNFLPANKNNKNAWCGHPPDTSKGFGYYPPTRAGLELPVLSALLRYDLILTPAADGALIGTLTLKVDMDDRRDGKLTSNLAVSSNDKYIAFATKEITDPMATLSNCLKELLARTFDPEPSLSKDFYQRFFNLANPFVVKRCPGGACLDLKLDQNRFRILVQTQAEVLSIENGQKIIGVFQGKCLDNKYLAHEVSGGAGTLADGDQVELRLLALSRSGWRSKCPK